MASNDNKLILIDGSSFLYRAYFAVRQRFSTKTGIPTGATFVFTRMLQSLLSTYSGAKFIVVFDAPGGAEFRKKMYADYKANRPPMPEELQQQVKWVYSIVNAMGLPLIQMEGVEADDILGSYALSGSLAGKEVVIATGDKDLAQLVNDERHISMVDTMREVTYDEAEVKAKFGVPPEHIIDLLALKGDSSDNIPGMKGVGDKTALALIEGLGGVFEIKERLDEVANLSFRGAAKFKERFLEQWDDIELSYRLATIRCDVKLPLPIEKVAPPQPNIPELLALYQNLELHSFATKLLEQQESSSQAEAKGGAATSESSEEESFDLLPTPPHRMAAYGRKKRLDESKGLARQEPTVLAQAALGPAQVTGAVVAEFGSLVPQDLMLNNELRLSRQRDALQQAQGTAQRRNNVKWLNWVDCALSGLGHGQPLLHDLKSHFQVVSTTESLKVLIERLKSCTYFGWYAANNLPAQGVSIADGDLVGIALCPDGQDAFYVPLAHSYLGAEQLSLAVVKRALGPIFADDKYRKVAFNCNQMQLMLSFAGMEVAGDLPDPVIVTHLDRSDSSLDFSHMCQSHLGYTPIELSSMMTFHINTCNALEIDHFKDYACEQALLTWHLYAYTMAQLALRPDWLELLDFDHEVNHVVYAMERYGVTIDSEQLHQQSRSLKESLFLTEQDIFDFAGEQFNLQSPKKLGEVLFEQMALPYPTSKDFKLVAKAVQNARAQSNSTGKSLDAEVRAILQGLAANKEQLRKEMATPAPGAKRRTRQSYSTADEILSEVNKIHPIGGCIQRYRMLSKLISTYADKLPNLISKRTGRIHAVFNVAGTVTGRLSSSAPNLQNIPSRTEEGRQIRMAFVAPEGYTLLSADYSQIELRLIAHFSRDPNLIAAFQNGLDIHRATAAEVLGKPIEQVTAEERAHAKATNFGLMYGMQAHGLSRQTHMSYQQAKAYIERYFQRYPRIATFMEQVVATAKINGYVTTLMGNRIYIEGLKGSGQSARGAERAAVNAPMQGSAADIIKKAMIEVSAYIKTLPHDAVRLTLQVHDELVFEVRDDLVESFGAKVKEIMEQVVTLAVPLKVGIGVAHCWADAH